MTTPREALLARIVGDVASHGLGDRSLRDLATSIGTSHRMLLYHFGSREALVMAIVDSVEAAQREAVGPLAVDVVGPAEALRRAWASVTNPEVLPFAKLFYEAAAHASRHGGAELTSPWLAGVEAAGGDPVLVRLAIAVIRGLLIDVITGDHPEDAAAALERFAHLLEVNDALPATRTTSATADGSAPARRTAAKAGRGARR